MADDLKDAIKQNADGPAEARGDSGSVRQHSVKDQIEADKYLPGGTQGGAPLADSGRPRTAGRASWGVTGSHAGRIMPRPGGQDVGETVGALSLRSPAGVLWPDVLRSRYRSCGLLCSLQVCCWASGR